MALEITGNILLDSAIGISSCYARTEANLSTDGNTVVVYPYVWASKTAYDNGFSPIRPEFLNNITPSVPYNRLTDGADILDFSNQSVKTTLEGLGYTVTITDL